MNDEWFCVDLRGESVFFPYDPQFTAMIRLPDHVSKADKMARIDEIVDALHLRNCLDTSKTILMVFVLVLHMYVRKMKIKKAFATCHSNLSKQDNVVLPFTKI